MAVVKPDSELNAFVLEMDLLNTALPTSMFDSLAQQSILRILDQSAIFMIQAFYSAVHAVSPAFLFLILRESHSAMMTL
jgi:hypothetical protein